MTSARVLPVHDLPLFGGREARKRQHPGPWCLFVLTDTAQRVIPLREREDRRLLHMHKGLAYEQCGHPATHEIDDVPHCERHAAALALELLLAGQL